MRRTEDLLEGAAMPPERLGVLTKTLRMFLVATSVMTVLGGVAAGFEYYSYATAPAGFDPVEDLLPASLISCFVLLFQVSLWLATAACFLGWVYHTTRNLRLLSGAAMVFTPGWAVAWYFIPFLNLFKPYQAMKELWRVCHKNQQAPLLWVHLWWVLWLVSNVSSLAPIPFVWGAESVMEHATLALLTAVTDGIDLVLTIVLLKMVTHLDHAYRRNFQGPPGTTLGSGEVTERTGETESAGERWLRHEVWPSIPPEVRGRGIPREEQDESLGYGPGGV